MVNWFSARILLAGFIIVLATLLVLLVVGNLRRDSGETLVAPVRQDADLAMQKINYTETQDGRRKWSIQADSASHDFKQSVSVISNVRMTLFDQTKGDTVVSARQGRFDISAGVVTLSDHVVVRDGSGQTIYADDVEFVGKRNQIRSDRSVRIESDAFTLSGVGFVYDLERKQLRLRSSVEASFRGALRMP